MKNTFTTDALDDGAYDARLAAAVTGSRRACRGDSESKIAEQIDGALRDAAAEHGASLHVINTYGDAMSRGGTPDRLGVVGGRAIAIEIKRPGEHPTRRQHVELQRWQAAEALAGWVESVVHVHELMARLHDRQWVNPLTGPGDPTLGASDVGSAREHAGSSSPPAGDA